MIREILAKLPPKLRDKNKSLIISYFSLRNLIGWLGMFLPIICLIGGYVFPNHLEVMKPSISDYYHSNMKDFLVGILIAVSVFLITYKGSTKIENYVTNVIGAAGAGIALFPCLDNTAPLKLVGIFQVTPGFSNTTHFICAGAFFLLLSFNSLYFFADDIESKDDADEVKFGIDIKATRNKIYKWCGRVIFYSIIVLAVIKFIVIKWFIEPQKIDDLKIVFIFEFIMLWAFGISWLVKGKTLRHLAGLSKSAREKALQYYAGISKLARRQIPI